MTAIASHPSLSKKCTLQHFSATDIAVSMAVGVGVRGLTADLELANIAVAFALLALVIWRMCVALRQNVETIGGDENKARRTLESIMEAVIRVDANGRVEYMNPAAERLIDIPMTEARGRSFSSLVTIADAAANDALSSDVFPRPDETHPLDPEILPEMTLGSTPISAHAEPLADDWSKGAVFVLRDVTRERSFIDQLSWQASHDELTGLANRRELDRKLRTRNAAPGSEPREDALLVLDLDQFKLVNDTCGHAAGDQLLREIATILKQGLRESDLPVRLGGDEFAAFITACDVSGATTIAERLRKAIQNFTFVWETRPFKVSASIGLVAGIDATTNINDAYRAADVACYVAKSKGRNRVELHQPTGVEILKHVNEMGWVHKIRDALDKGHLCLHAQRIAPLQGQMEDAHFELLVRMHDDHGKLVPPGSFIPAAERYCLMPSLDRWILNSAFANLAQISAGGRGSAIRCSINLSGQSLDDPTFIEFVQSQFLIYPVDPSVVTFEITETMAIANLEEATKFIQTFRAMGCTFSLDDFGAGMSSFGYLKRLPVDYLKIDGGFVKNMLFDPIDYAMVDMIARMARTLGKKTIAEFAETDEIVDALRALGVDYAQGYAISRPVPVCIQFGREKLICFSTNCGLRNGDDELSRHASARG